MVTSWALLLGLAESKASLRTYLGIDLQSPSRDALRQAKRLTRGNGNSMQDNMKAMD